MGNNGTPIKTDLTRLLKEFKRQSGYAAKKHAERALGASSAPAAYFVTMQFYDMGMGNEVNVELSCQSSCETRAEGPLDEAGGRSHGQGAYKAFRGLGATYARVVCHLGRVDKHPLKYQVVGVDLEELVLIDS